MLSIKDITIISMFQNMRHELSEEEINLTLDRLDDPRNRKICLVVLGKEQLSKLNEREKSIFSDIKNWPQITRTEESSEREIRLAKKLKELFRKGIISERDLLLYGISGKLPSREEYSNLSHQEQEALWNNRIRQRGINRLISIIKKDVVLEGEMPDWIRDGF